MVHISWTFLFSSQGKKAKRWAWTEGSIPCVWGTDSGLGAPGSW